MAKKPMTQTHKFMRPLARIMEQLMLTLLPPHEREAKVEVFEDHGWLEYEVRLRNQPNQPLRAVRVFVYERSGRIHFDVKDRFMNDELPQSLTQVSKVVDLAARILMRGL